MDQVYIHAYMTISSGEYIHIRLFQCLSIGYMYFHRHFFGRKIVTLVYNFLTVLVHTHINMKHIRICMNKVWVHTLIRKINIFAYFCVKVEL